MLTEFCIACALPHSVTRNAPFHVSLFFSPTIRTTTRAVLKASPLFVDWAKVLRGSGAWSLVIKAGEILLRALLEPVRPRTLARTVSAGYAHFVWQLPRWGTRKWRSFAARQVHDIAAQPALATMYSDPTQQAEPR